RESGLPLPAASILIINKRQVMGDRSGGRRSGSHGTVFVPWARRCRTLLRPWSFVLGPSSFVPGPSSLVLRYSLPVLYACPGGSNTTARGTRGKGQRTEDQRPRKGSQLRTRTDRWVPMPNPTVEKDANRGYRSELPLTPAPLPQGARGKLISRRSQQRGTNRPVGTNTKSPRLGKAPTVATRPGMRDSALTVNTGGSQGPAPTSGGEGKLNSGLNSDCPRNDS